jgi:hypothetical protein
MNSFQRINSFHFRISSLPKPAIKVVGDTSKIHRGASKAAVGGTASLLSALSIAADLMPHDEINLHNFLKVRYAAALQAAKRASWFGGRWFNSLSGEDPDYIPISGAHLTQTLAVKGLTPPDFILPRGKYLLRLDYAEKAIVLLLERITQRETDHL